eukprot:2909269-Pyramimonas_sp.AAC.1
MWTPGTRGRRLGGGRGRWRRQGRGCRAARSRREDLGGRGGSRRACRWRSCRYGVRPVARPSRSGPT